MNDQKSKDKPVFYRENKWKPVPDHTKVHLGKPFLKEEDEKKVTRPMSTWGFFIDSSKSTSWFNMPKMEEFDLEAQINFPLWKLPKPASRKKKAQIHTIIHKLQQQE